VCDVGARYTLCCCGGSGGARSRRTVRELGLEADLLGVDTAIARGENAKARALARALLQRPEANDYRALGAYPSGSPGFGPIRAALSVPDVPIAITERRRSRVRNHACEVQFAAVARQTELPKSGTPTRRTSDEAGLNGVAPVPARARLAARRNALARGVQIR
jgi:hypothetical protein